MSLTDAATTAPDADQHVQRLLVSRQGADALYRPLGFLDARQTLEGVEYGFAYLRTAVDQPEFRPLLGFPQARRYTALGLFPLFAERLMDPRRPDHPAFLAALDLSSDASPLMVLERSAGHRVGDRIELTTVPHTDHHGHTSCVFLVHGVRHLDGAEDRISSLRDGDALALRSQPDNPVNPAAMLVTIDGADGGPVGWVPDVLLPYVEGLSDRQVTAVRVNAPEVGPRLRLLVQLSGDAAPGWSPFAGSAWETAE